MLDDQTMRFALGAVSLTVLVLFYLGVYRPTRSGFSAWWSVSLLLAGLAILLLLFNDSPVRAVTYPMSTALAAAGSTCVWFAMRSLRSRRLPRWLLAVGPLAILVPASMATPDESGMATTGPVSLYMATMFIAGAAEAWKAWQTRRVSADGEPNAEALVALLVIAIAATALGSFYSLRFVMLMVAGPDSGAFERTAGSAPEDVTLLVCMVAVTFSVSAVGWDQQTRTLRRLAMKDDLTGLWGRSEFRAQAKRAMAGAQARGEGALLVVADLDHFKDINDTHGHAAGDSALMVFAAVVTSHLRPEECAGRLGGEEFGLVLLDVDDADALVRLRALSDDFASRSTRFDFPLPTVSYGVAGPRDGDSVDQVFEQADQAMYVAKAQGRDRAVRYTEEIGRRPSNLLRRRQSDREDVAEPL
ncbi:GGDEF domain-containing protein [Demequina muriae]|uniref:GGDEF domain-containing protein n=1 Tax=Demequina muriae TaxID=3051664 RepID=A0ABT8GID0_9MICO|nr:GGDEF domain-containing protein [Demequina sp. EGI L300058]MDN4481178.1 GGDEF domain-containing protein [Demequina sp. EGI L300058]